MCSNLKITIITITYNLIKAGREQMFRQCVESVHNQTYQNIEHIVIDGASNDGTVKLLETYARRGWIKYYSEKDNGIYDAMNKGLRLATGDYIAFLNSDDYYHDKKGIRELAKFLAKNPVDFCYSRCRYVKENGDYFGMLVHKAGSWFVHMPFSHQTLFVKTDLMRQMGGFDEAYKSAADYEFIVRLFMSGAKSSEFFYSFVSYRTGGFSEKQVDISRQECIRCFEKNFKPLYAKLNSEALYDKQLVPEALYTKLCHMVSDENKVLMQQIWQSAVLCSKKMYKVTDWQTVDFQCDDVLGKSQRFILFNFLPLMSHTKKGGREQWNILGLPIFKIRRFANGMTTKYYVLNLPLIKSSRKIHLSELPNVEETSDKIKRTEKKTKDLLKVETKQYMPSKKLEIKDKKNQDKPIKVLFDATILNMYTTKGARRTGIFWTAYNIVTTLAKRTDIKLFLWSTKPNITKAFIKDRLPQAEYYDGDVSKMDVFFSSMYKIDQNIRNTGIPCFTVLYDCIVYLYPQSFQGINVTWFDEMCRSLTKDDYCFAISKHTKEDFLKFVPQLDAEKVKVMPLATNITYHPHQVLTDEIRNKYNIPKNKKYLFSLCSLEPRKNLIRAVKTFITFIEKNKINDLVFVLGGSAWKGFIERLESEVPHYKEYKSKIIRAGYVDDEDLEALYGNAEWFVYTSQYEGFGMPPLEAMSCGTAVITSNNSSLPEIVGATGQKIDWDSDEQHVAAYEKYYFDEKYRHAMAAKGLKRSGLFSWEKATDIIVTTFQQCTQQNPRSSFVLRTLQAINEKHQTLSVKVLGLLPAIKINKSIYDYRVKVFGFFSLYTHSLKDGREKWKVCGLPVFKIRKMANGITTKYYILGVPVMKVSKKVQSV